MEVDEKLNELLSAPIQYPSANYVARLAVLNEYAAKDHGHVKLYDFAEGITEMPAPSEKQAGTLYLTSQVSYLIYSEPLHYSFEISSVHSEVPVKLAPRSLGHAD